MEFGFFVEAVPVAKARPRATTVGGAARMYTPQKTRNFEGLVKRECLKHCQMFIGPVSVVMAIVLPVPKSWSKKKQTAALSGVLLPASRPDLDNYIKAVLDGLNGAAFIDDSQVIAISARKMYGNRVGVQVYIEGDK